MWMWDVARALADDLSVQVTGLTEGMSAEEVVESQLPERIRDRGAPVTEEEDARIRELVCRELVRRGLVGE